MLAILWVATDLPYIRAALWRLLPDSVSKCLAHDAPVLATLSLLAPDHCQLLPAHGNLFHTHKTIFKHSTLLSASSADSLSGGPNTSNTGACALCLASSSGGNLATSTPVYVYARITLQSSTLAGALMSRGNGPLYLSKALWWLQSLNL